MKALRFCVMPPRPSAPAKNAWKVPNALLVKPNEDNFEDARTHLVRFLLSRLPIVLQLILHRKFAIKEEIQNAVVAFVTYIVEGGDELDQGNKAELMRRADEAARSGTPLPPSPAKEEEGSAAEKNSMLFDDDTDDSDDEGGPGAKRSRSAEAEATEAAEDQLWKVTVDTLEAEEKSVCKFLLFRALVPLFERATAVLADPEAGANPNAPTHPTWQQQQEANKNTVNLQDFLLLLNISMTGSAVERPFLLHSCGGIHKG
jgi:hypothetical protein